MTIQQSQFDPYVKPASGDTVQVSIIIKALNEEKKIAAAIESALAAVSIVGGEVILADSLSNDRTVEIASSYPIKIVQLTDARDRRCGVGPQLGFQHARGEYIYILDGDMEILPDFLPKALSLLQKMPTVAGVGGQLIELNTESLEYRSRTERIARDTNFGEVTRLDGGGLYRREAIEQALYFSDQNLHSYEEFDLGLRLRANNWQLWRIDAKCVTHQGHDAPPYLLLAKRWQSAYICGLGELVRASWGTPRFLMLSKEVKELKLYVAVLLWWAVLAVLWTLPASISERTIGFAALLLAPVLAMAVRKKSLNRAIFAVVSWSFNAAGLVRGVFQVRKPAQQRISDKLVTKSSVKT